MKEYYFLDSSNEEKGPLSLDQLKTAGLKPETYVWTAGLDNWKQAKEFEELEFVSKKAPPPIPNKPKEMIEKKKGKKQGCIILFCIFVVITIIIGIFSKDDENKSVELANKTDVSSLSDTKDVQKEAKEGKSEIAESKDSLLLIQYIYGNSELGKRKDIEISVRKLDANNCQILCIIPNDSGSSFAEVIGSGICMLAAKWMSGNKYDLSKMNLFCMVGSPYKGVTERKDMMIPWGSCHYIYSSDNLKWVPASE